MALRNLRFFNDVIYNKIQITKIANTIIDTKIFQRLRDIKQLGTMYLVFSSCNHSRFEHSIGTYHLSDKFIKKIINNSLTDEINKPLIMIPFIKNYLYKKHNFKNDDEIINNNEKLLDDFIIELINISALCHDLGHSCFSHLFDEYLKEQPELLLNPLIHHEYRSTILLKIILETTKIDDILLIDIITEDGYKFICDLINPNKKTPNIYLYQFVSNKLNSLDVDKLDYLMRDTYYLGKTVPFDYERIINNAMIINNNIHFNEKINYDIYLVFRTRYDMHKQYYTHKMTVCMNLMINDLIHKLDKFLNIKQMFIENKIDKFIELTDSTILTFTSLYKQLNLPYNVDINEIDNFINNIKIRNVYKCVYVKSYLENEEINIDNIINELELNKDNYFYKIQYIGLGGNKKLFKNIYFYDKNYTSKILQNNEISHIISSFSQEKILYIIKKI